VATRTTPSGLQISNLPAPSAFANGISGGWIGRAVLTGEQTVAGTAISLTGSSLSVTVNANRWIKLSFSGAYAMSGGAGNRARFAIQEGSTEHLVSLWAASTNGTEAASFFVCLQPSAGAHTYFVSLASPDGGNAVLKGAATLPCTFLIEDIGPT
jgi:hypothetical protein